LKLNAEVKFVQPNLLNPGNNLIIVLPYR
jgi:hypothetical protein